MKLFLFWSNIVTKLQIVKKYVPIQGQCHKKQNILQILQVKGVATRNESLL